MKAAVLQEESEELITKIFQNISKKVKFLQILFVKKESLSSITQSVSTGPLSRLHHGRDLWRYCVQGLPVTVHQGIVQLLTLLHELLVGLCHVQLWHGVCKRSQGGFRAPGEAPRDLDSQGFLLRLASSLSSVSESLRLIPLPCRVPLRMKVESTWRTSCAISFKSWWLFSTSFSRLHVPWLAWRGPSIWGYGNLIKITKSRALFFKGNVTQQWKSASAVYNLAGSHEGCFVENCWITGLCTWS